MSKIQPDYTDAPMGCDVEEKGKDEGIKKLEVPVTKTFFLCSRICINAYKSRGDDLNTPEALSTYISRLVASNVRILYQQGPSLLCYPKNTCLGQIT